MITYEKICEKLGFDFMTYKSETSDTEDDSRPNPFSVLNVEGLDFVIDYTKSHK